MAFKLIREDYLEVSPVHKIYFAEYGDRNGIPVIFFHGGPGSKSRESYLDSLPTDLPVRAILYDQRGCGQSQPQGELKENTTPLLIEDIEKLRRHLEIDKWLVVGGSWGSTLALLYAEKYPDQVRGLVLKSVFLARKQDQEWLYSPSGAGQFFPDKAEAIKLYLKKHHLQWPDFIDHAHQLMLTGKEKEKKQVAVLISNWEHGLMNLDVSPHLIKMEDVDEEIINSTAIYCHYSINHFFIRENQIIENIKAIEKIPTVIIHGRYDMVCPPEGAYLLHQNLANSKLVFVNYASHHLGWDGNQWTKELIKEMIAE